MPRRPDRAQDGLRRAERPRLSHPRVLTSLPQRRPWRRSARPPHAIPASDHTLFSALLVLISSHIVEDLAGVADHVLHLAQGRLVFAGTSQEYVEATGTSGHVDSVERWTEAYRTWNAKDRKAVSA